MVFNIAYMILETQLNLTVIKAILRYVCT